MFKPAPLITLISLAFSVGASANCTYKDAQSKSVQATNLQAEYSKDMIREMKEYGEPLPSKAKVRNVLHDKLLALGIELAKEYEKNPNIQYTDSVNPTLCKEYDAILTEYARSDAPVKAINLEPKALSKACNLEKIWERFGAVRDESLRLLQAGKLSDDVQTEQQLLMVEFGQNATTDLNAACHNLEQLEASNAKNL